MLISAKNICRHFDIGNNQPLSVLQDVTLEIGEGQVVAIVGPSGAGKSTLLHILGFLDRPSSGELLFEGKNVFSQKDEEIAKVRNKNIGFIFQFHHLLPEFTAFENIIMPSLIAGESIKNASKRGNELLFDVGLTHRADHKPNELSGGEQQRIAVARALMNAPKLILADEPSGNLDSQNAKNLHAMVMQLREKYNQTFVIVTHNEDFASMADKTIKMNDGKITSSLI